MDIYDIDKIISEALRSHIDISPSDRKEWKMFCCSLKVLGYDESTFVALSSGKESDSRQAWRAERNPSRYKSEDDAKAMIVALAKSAGMDVRQYYLVATKHPTKYPTKYRSTPTIPAPTQPIVPLHITEQQLKATSSRFRETSLYIYLCKWFAASKVDGVMAAYRVGASKYDNPQGGKATCFPYISTNGHCIDCKIFHIDPTTGSRKTAPPLRSWTAPDGTPQHLPTTWALAEMKMKDRRDKWCNFGDHLLSDRPTDKVCLVESEKSALILSLAYPQHIWVAVGSMQNLVPERLVPYKGREITIYPDRDGIPIWRDKARMLAASGYNIRIDTTTQLHKGAAKDDLADIVIRSLQGMQQPPTPAEPDTEASPSPDRQEAIKVWADMTQHYPHLAEFAKFLQLQPIRVFSSI